MWQQMLQLLELLLELNEGQAIKGRKRRRQRRDQRSRCRAALGLLQALKEVHLLLQRREYFGVAGLLRLVGVSEARRHNDRRDGMLHSVGSVGYPHKTPKTTRRVRKHSLVRKPWRRSRCDSPVGKVGQNAGMERGWLRLKKLLLLLLLLLNECGKRRCGSLLSYKLFKSRKESRDGCVVQVESRSRSRSRGWLLKRCGQGRAWSRQFERGREVRRERRLR